MSNYQLRLLQYEEQENHFEDIRMVEIEWEMRFVWIDVAKVLGYSKPNEAIKKYTIEKGTLKWRIPTDWWFQETTLISESNIYRLVMWSKSKSAEKFRCWLFDDVLPQIRKKGFYGRINRIELPNFIERYKDNYHKIPKDYFSVISELFITVYQELEKYWYQIPDKALDGKQIMLDISVGKTFSNYLKKNYPEWYQTKRTYKHSFPDWRDSVNAYMYPIDALPVFRRFVFEVRFPEHADEYFRQRDPLALNYIPLVLWVAEGVEKPTMRISVVNQKTKIKK